MSYETRVLAEDADWEAIAEWCGGYLVNIEIADSGDYDTVLMIPRAGRRTITACEGDIVLRSPDRKFVIYEPKEDPDETAWWQQHVAALNTQAVTR